MGYMLRDLPLKDFKKKKPWVEKLVNDYEQQKIEQQQQAEPEMRQ